MSKGLVIVLVAAVALAGAFWFLNNPSKKDKKEKINQPLPVSRHTPSFINSVDSALESYYSSTDALVKWDSLNIDSFVVLLEKKLNAIQIQELKKDTGGIYETGESFLNYAKNDVEAMKEKKNLEWKRRSLNSLSENLFNFLRIIRYDKSKLYLQECPMAFNDTESGLWLSKTPEIRNPYLGLYHPRYKSGMLKCGETRETLNYSGIQ